MRVSEIDGTNAFLFAAEKGKKLTKQLLPENRVPVRQPLGSFLESSQGLFQGEENEKFLGGNAQ